MYLVKFEEIASTAACLIFCGVGKSGSPAPKSTTSAPSRRRRSASAETFSVEETLILDIRSAISDVACILLLSINLTRRGLFRAQTGCHNGRNEACDISSKLRNLPDHARADE